MEKVELSRSYTYGRGEDAKKVLRVEGESEKWLCYVGHDELEEALRKDGRGQSFGSREAAA